MGVQKYQVLFICFPPSFFVMIIVLSSSSCSCDSRGAVFFFSRKWSSFYFSHDLLLLPWIAQEEGGKNHPVNVAKRQEWNNVRAWLWRGKPGRGICLFCTVRTAGSQAWTESRDSNEVVGRRRWRVQVPQRDKSLPANLVYENNAELYLAAWLLCTTEAEDQEKWRIRL